MKKLVLITISFIMISLLVSISLTFAQELKPIKLLPPQMDSGKPFMQVLKERETSREFRSDELPLQVLSNLLWAAWGINRPESGKRTAPSAVNWQEIEVYVSTADGLYLYNAQEHILNQVLAQDIRAKTGTQDFIKNAPVNLIFVADYSKMASPSDEDKRFLSGADAGFISQNVYLFCASEGLATVVRGLIDRTSLREVMKLSPNKKIVLAQTVGYPKR